MNLKETLISKLDKNDFSGFMNEMDRIYNAGAKNYIDLEKTFLSEDEIFYIGYEAYCIPSDKEFIENPKVESKKVLVLDDNYSIFGKEYVKAIYVDEKNISHVLKFPKDKLRKINTEN